MLAMWGKALRTIPRLSGDEWNALDIVSQLVDCDTRRRPRHDGYIRNDCWGVGLA